MMWSTDIYSTRQFVTTREIPMLVGAIQAPIKGKPPVKIYPIVVMRFKERVKPPRHLQIAYRDSEGDPEEGRRRYIWLYEPARPDIGWGVLRVSPENRDVFERLRKHWGWWFLTIGHDDGDDNYQVCQPTGMVYPLNTKPEESLADVVFPRQRLISHVKKGLLTDKRMARPDGSVSQVKYTPKMAHKAAVETADKLEQLGGPLPWELDVNKMAAQVSRERQKAVIQMYSTILSVLAIRGQHEDKTQLIIPESDKWLVPSSKKKLKDEILTTAWALLRQARIFELSHQAYAVLHHSADIYTTERIAGMKWVPEEEHSKLMEEEAKAHLELITEAGYRVPFPDQMPFEVCYFAWGSGVILSRINMKLRGMKADVGLLVATLVAAQGDVFEIITTADGGGMSIIPICHEGKWKMPYVLSPWIITALVAGINEHRSLIMEQGRTWEARKHFKKLAREIKIKPLPPPYYTVYLQDQHITESARREYRRQSKVLWSHRWDVRGHEMIRIRKGTMPIDPRLERKLRKRGYKVFTLDIPDSESYRAVMKKGVSPPKPGEWLAVRISWRDAFVKGPKDKPYIPSVRKPTKGMVAK